VLQSRGRHLAPGRHPGDVDEYYVEIDLDGQVYHSSLGFGHDTLRSLQEMALSLEPDHRAPIQDIVQRVRPALEPQAP
jgi:hypothetical protein